LVLIHVVVTTSTLRPLAVSQSTSGATAEVSESSVMIT